MADRRRVRARPLRRLTGHAPRSGRPGSDRARSRHGLGRRPERVVHPRRARAVSAASAAPLGIELDHLVVACRTLAAGRAWCEATFGVAPETGGRHPLMSTHNALLAVSSARFPRAYLELIAIDPDALAPAHPRWYDLDRVALQAIIDQP